PRECKRRPSPSGEISSACEPSSRGTDRAMTVLPQRPQQHLRRPRHILDPMPSERGPKLPSKRGPEHELPASRVHPYVDDDPRGGRQLQPRNRVPQLHPEPAEPTDPRQLPAQSVDRLQVSPTLRFPYAVHDPSLRSKAGPVRR